jgi:hypothetical protein
MPDAVDTIVWAPDGGWKYHPKYVEQFPDINKLCDVASCWIYEYIGILLGARPILHISRIKVKGTCSVWVLCSCGPNCYWFSNTPTWTTLSFSLHMVYLSFSVSLLLPLSVHNPNLNHDNPVLLFKFHSPITRWRIWLKHCVTKRKVASSFPDGVTEIFLLT